MSTYVFELILSGSSPKVWRKLSLPGRYKLRQVHKMMQILFGWQGYHLHEFVFGSKRYTDLETVDDVWGDDDSLSNDITLEKALGKDGGFRYHYDFGDSWEVIAKLKQTLEIDRDCAEVMDGALAGPPEDCGGIPGFQQLKTILNNPRHPDYDGMRKWAPRGYDGDAFSKDAINKKLLRGFGRKAPKPKIAPDAVLAGYRLSRLSLAEAMMAALLEQSPSSLESLEARFEELGYPLAQGQESLRRSLATSKVIRVRGDGRLELVKGPVLESLQRSLDFRAGQGFPKAAPVAEPLPVTGPVTAEELTTARAFGIFPPQFSLRRKLTLLLDTGTGRAGLLESLKSLQKLEQRIQPGLEKSVQTTLRGYQALRVEGDELVLERDAEETEKARTAFRKWLLPYRRRELELAHQQAHFENFHRQRLASNAEHQEEFRKLTKAVLAGHWADEHFAVVVLDPATGNITWTVEVESAAATIAEQNLLVGLDPLGLFEKLGWASDGKKILDLTPTFKSVPTPNGGRRKLAAGDAIKMVTGRSLSDPEKLSQWLARGHIAKVRKALESDALDLFKYWRYGVLHGAVPRGHESAAVEWNLGRELPLSYALEWCIEDGQPLRLTLLDGTTGMFAPEHRTSWMEEPDGQSRLRGRWLGGHASLPLVAATIADFEYPYPISPERWQTVYFH